jgi:ATP/maltotriose-dependent transcriptional regulator MalT
MLEWARGTGMRSLEASALNVMARATAMRGDLEKARRLIRATEGIAVDLGEMLLWAATPLTAGLVELLAGDPAAAEVVLRHGYERALRVGGAGPLANLGAMLARALLQQDRDEEAEAMVARCRTAPLTQLDVHIRARGIESVLLARRGSHVEAQRRAADAVSLAERSEQLDTQATALMDMAEVERIGDRPREAGEAARRAFARYQAKGNLMGVAEVERFLRRLKREASDSSSGP